MKIKMRFLTQIISTSLFFTALIINSISARSQSFINYTFSNSINAIAVDSNGTAWLGANGRSDYTITGIGGLVKFDGINWFTYTTADGLPSDGITSIVIDKHGNLWMGTFNAGLVKYDGVKFINYTSKDGLPSNGIYSIAIDSKGNKWIGTNSGLSKFNDTTFTNFLTINGSTDSQAYSIAIDGQDRKWIGTLGSGVFVFNDTTWSNYKYPNDPLSSNAIFSIAIDSNNNKWFGTEFGISKFDGNTWTNYTKVSGLNFAGNNINSISVDKENNKWFGTSSGGVAKFDDVNWTIYNTSNALPSDQIYAVYVDKHNNKWAGTNGNGVLKFNDTSWVNYYDKNCLNNNMVFAVGVDKQDNKWFGTDNGLSKFDGQDWTHYYNPSGSNFDGINCISFDHQGELWLGTGDGAVRFDGSTWTNYPINTGTLNHTVYAVAVDPLNNKWFGTYYGLIKFDGVNWKTYTTKDGLTSNFVRSIAFDPEGNMWVGTDQGASKFDGNNWGYYFGGSWVYSILIDSKGVIWFGTGDHGVVSFDGTGYYYYSTNDGLPSNDIRCLKEDKQGNIWAGTDNGISKLNGHTWTSYHTSDGLVYDDIYSVGMDKAGNLWFGSYLGGISEITPCSFHINLGQDKILCGDNSSLKLDASVLGKEYLWSTGDTTQSITVTQDNNYWVRVWDNKCILSDTVSVSKLISPNLGKDTILCPKASIQLRLSHAWDTYLWSTGNHTPSVEIDQAGKFWVNVSKSNCNLNSDTIQINYSKLSVDIEGDSLICGVNNHSTLTAQSASSQFLWSNGNHSQKINVSESGRYWVTVSDGICINSDTITITKLLAPSLGHDTTLCISNEFTLQAPLTWKKYSWSTGDSTNSIQVPKDGNYSVTVSKGSCILSSNIIKVHFIDPSAIFIPNLISPNNDNKNDYLVIVNNPKDNKISIYNRWGEKVFENKEYENSWSAEGLESGIYYYDYKTRCAERKGWVEVVK